jgi:hypothetical protein
MCFEHRPLRPAGRKAPREHSSGKLSETRSGTDPSGERAIGQIYNDFKWLGAWIRPKIDGVRRTSFKNGNLLNYQPERR